MNKAFIGGIVAVVVIVGAGIYVSQQKTHDAAMMAEKAAQEAQAAIDTEKMHKEEAMQKEAAMAEEAKAAMMKKDEAMTPHDGVVKDDSMMKKDGAITGDKKAMAQDGSMMHAGTYEAYSAEKIAMKAATGKVVLFFRAGWCPTCRTADADIKAHLSSIPANLTILDVDYDASTDLKTKYGVTYQHTFVEVDAKGGLVKKWSGSATLAALVAEVQ